MNNSSIVKGADLTAPIHTKVPAEMRRVLFNVGMLPTLPKTRCTFAGQVFPRSSGIVVPSMTDDSKGIMQERIGGLAWFTRDEIDVLADRVKRTIVRFGQANEPTGEIDPDTGKERMIPSTCKLIYIQTEEELAHLRKLDRVAHTYRPQESDRPIAEFLFMVPCANQEVGDLLPTVPEPLSVTGIVWPTDEKPKPRPRRRPKKGDVTVAVTEPANELEA